MTLGERPKSTPLLGEDLIMIAGPFTADDLKKWQCGISLTLIYVHVACYI